MFVLMAAIYIVQRDHIPDLSSIKGVVEEYCSEIVEDENTITFTPRNGFVATLGLYFTRQAISYQLQFNEHRQ
jgi:CRISPR/Cas system CMR subunit Cmr6 (Cas7 group RAMP superfamily)